MTKVSTSKVYVVVYQHYSDGHVALVYTTQELAEKAVERLGNKYYWEEIEVLSE